MNYTLATVNLFVRDIPTSRQFYTEKLGIKADEAQSDDSTFVFLPMKGECALLLQAARTADAGISTAPGGVEVGFEVDDVDATWEAWKGSGVKMLNEPHDKPFGRTFNATDPDGHLLNVYKLVGR
ncbi:MAG: VOC family protein [Chloroflexota bacterium]|nr:VOC family protein [Chloroflexota bacterium]